MRPLRTHLAKSILLALCACAPSIKTSPPEIAPITVQVTNVWSEEVAIYVVGRRTRRLGEVQGLSNVTFYVRFSDLKPDGSCRLVASRQFRGPFASSEVLMPGKGHSIRLSIQSQGIFASVR